MPNPSSERGDAPRQPHARPRSAAAGPTPGNPPPRHSGGGAAGALKTPAGVGLAIVALVAVVVALAGALGGPFRSPNSVPIAEATTVPTDPAGSAAAAAPPTPTEGPVGTPSTSGPPGSPPASTPLPTPRPEPSPTPEPSPSPRNPLAGVPVTRLQKAVDAWRRKTGSPGVSVAIVWDDGRAWAGASGKADIAANRPMTTGTGFAFASVSKMFTAAVVLQLIDEGKVRLDQSASELLPEYPLDPRITVRMLMDHRSSLPDFFSNAKFDKVLQGRKDATWTPRQTWKYVPKWRPTPGTIYDYSNTNYMLLGELVKNVTGKPLSVEVRKRVLDPLELSTAWFQAAETPRVKGAVAYRGSGASAAPVSKTQGTIMPFRSVVTAAAGAGSIAGTATDAARFVQAYGSGRIQGRTMFHEMLDDSRYTKAMHAIVTYGLGVQVITIEGQKTLGHSGRYLGYQNTVRYLRGPGIAIAILTNQSVNDPAKLMHSLIRIVAPK